MIEFVVADDDGDDGEGDEDDDGDGDGGDGDDGGDGANRSLFNHLPPWAPCHNATPAQCRERFPKLGQRRLWRRWL